MLSFYLIRLTDVFQEMLWKSNRQSVVNWYFQLNCEPKTISEKDKTLTSFFLK